jgi:hypothetical protein
VTIRIPADDLSDAGKRELRLAEFVAFGLLVVEGLAILGYLAAGIANQAQFGSQEYVGGIGGAHAWGYTLSIATTWSAPWVVAVFLLGPLALVAWIGRREGDEISEGRSRLVLRLELALAVLTALGGIVAVLGRALQVSPSQQWSAFLANLGTGVGSVCIGLVGIIVVRWLADDLQLELFTREDVKDVGQEEDLR